MKQSDYDKLLSKWAKNHYWDSLEKDKDLILRHLRTFVGDVIYKDETNNQMQSDAKKRCDHTWIESVCDVCIECGDIRH